MIKHAFIAASAAAMITLPAPSALAQEPGSPEFDAAIADYLERNPGVVVDALLQLAGPGGDIEDALTARKLATAGSILQEGPSFGAEDGPVIVEFSDYNCGFCRRASNEVASLVEERGLRLVVKEIPIISENSIVPARAAIAADMQGRYREFHIAMMATDGQADLDRVREVAGDIGLDWPRLRADMESDAVNEVIIANLRLARAVGVKATPTFVIGGRHFTGWRPGMVKNALDEAAAKTAP